MQFLLSSLNQPTMESEAPLVKYRRYDLSMSKRTRRSTIAAVRVSQVASVHVSEVNPREEEKEQKSKHEVNPGEEEGSKCEPEGNPGEEKGLQCDTVISRESEDGRRLECTPERDEAAVTERVSAPATPRPSLKELIQVTNKEETDARQATVEETEVVDKEKVLESEKEAKLLPAPVMQQQIVAGVKQPQPGMVRRCAKALNQIIKARHASKQKNAVTVIAT